MVELKSKVFLIASCQAAGRQKALAAVKAKLLNKNNSSLNLITLYPRELDLVSLQEKIAVFSFNREKLLIFKDFLTIPVQLKDYIFSHITDIISHNFLVFETARDYGELTKDKAAGKDKLTEFLLKNAFCVKISGVSEYIPSLDGFKSALRKRDLSTVLYVLEKLLLGSKSAASSLAPQILGILTAEFSYLKDYNKKQKSLHYLWQADRAIKEKGLDPRFIMEVVLIKLLLL
jgi:hypothetical protein